MTSELRFEKQIAAEPGEVYRMFTNSTALREWLADRALARPTPGGTIFLDWLSGFYAVGAFTSLEPESLIKFNLHGRGEPTPSQVEVHINARDGGTHITLIHSGLGEGDAWETPRKEIEHGWQQALMRLAHSLETGPDLRITTRPMLGILPIELTPQMASKLGFPVQQGLLMSDVIDGLGAYKAGLRKDDLVVALDGKPVQGYNDIPVIMQSKKAGDAVMVTFYRGPEKHQTEMILSARPLPEIPDSMAGLAAALKDIYDNEKVELSSVLADVTDGEANFKPSEDDWNVKEVLAHLIHGERGTQDYITELFTASERLVDNFGDNVNAYVKATADVYGTVQALEQAFYASRAETVNLIANLPESFARRKSTFWKLAYQILSYPYHVHDHSEQIKAAVAKARSK